MKVGSLTGRIRGADVCCRVIERVASEFGTRFES